MEPTIRSLCTGYGGLDLATERVFGGRLLDWSDVDQGSIAVMSHKHSGVPNLGDLKQVNWFAQDRTDILTAGYPCQPFSNAGLRLGTDDPRHLWPWIAQAIGVLRPRVIVLENVAAHLRRGFDIVSADLARIGYDAAWSVVRASDVGAPHNRRRLFILAVAPDTISELQHWAWNARQGRRSESSDLREFTAHADRAELRIESGRSGRPRGADQAKPGYLGAHAVSDAQGVGWDERRTESTGQLRRLDVAECGTPNSSRWGKYADAVARWESLRGLTAPNPTEVGKRGSRVLSPPFVEWMMGLPPGHVTDVPGLTRAQQLKLLGNGVVPQQAEHALRLLANVLITNLERAA